MEKKKGLGIATLVIAIIGLLGCWFPFLNIISITLFVVAIIMGIIAAVKDNGRILAIVGIVLALLGWFVSAKVNEKVADEAKKWIDSLSGEDIVITQSGEIKTGSDWFSGIISDGINELNNEIEAGVQEFSEGINEFNEVLSGEVNAGVERINEDIETVNNALTGSEAE